MSGRTPPRFTLAALLVAALAAPAVAQEMPQAPMPREKKAGVIEIQLGIELGSGPLSRGPAAFDFGTPPPIMPQPVPPDLMQLRDLRMRTGAACDEAWQPCPAQGFMTGGIGSARPAGAIIPAVSPYTRGPATMPNPHSARVKVIEVVAIDGCPACPPCPFPAVASNPLMGTWYRDAGVAMVSATFTHDEMKLCATQCEGGATITVTITAHYTLTKDGLVHGAITGADVDVKQSGKADRRMGMEFAELSMLLQELADVPFSFRVKMTSAGMMVSQPKAPSFQGAGGKDFLVFGGLYKHAKDGRVPEPASVNSDRAGRCESGYNPSDCPVPAPTSPYSASPVPTPVVAPPAPAPTMTAPCPPSCERVGIDFNAPPPPPIVCGDPMKQMAVEAFGQMLQQGGATSPVGGMMLPPPVYLNQCPQYLPAGAALPPPVAPKPGIVGKWVREFGARRCVVTVAADHMTIEVSESQEIDGKAVGMHATLTADYHLLRDGTTAVGLITSVDAKLDGDLPAGEVDSMMESMAEFRKAMEDRPFAMTCRVYGDSLVIGNVRMPVWKDRDQPSTSISGRYSAAGDKPLPKLKVVKGEVKSVIVEDPRQLQLPPPPPGYQPAPVNRPGATYGLPAPTGDLIPPQPIPAGVVPSVPPAGATTPSMPEPMQPVPSMPEPSEPGLSVGEAKPAAPATEMTVAWRNRVAYLPDPSRNGATGPGLVGQMFLVGGPKLQPAEPDGVLTVDLVDKTPRPAGQPAAKSERWQLDAETLKKLRATDETFGKCFELFLPWPGYKPDVTRVEISARYDPQHGFTLYSRPTVVTLEAGGANAQMQQLLEQSENLRPIENEWRRFWFNDQPAAPAPVPHMPEPTAPGEKPEPTMAVPVAPGINVTVPPLGAAPGGNSFLRTLANSQPQLFNFAG